MTIVTEPSGADVWVNESWHGKTPFELPFKHYGVFQIRIEKKGYYPMYVKEPVNAPFYQHMGPDIVAEALIPKKIEDNRELHYVLQKINEPDQVAGIMERAEELASKSDAIIGRRRFENATRDPVEIPFLPEDKPGSGKAAEEAQRQLAKDAMNIKPREAKPMDKLDPIEQLEK